MWMVTDRGFYSVVDKGVTEGELCVRARVRADLENLCELEPMEKYTDQIEASNLGDYRYRINVKREDWVDAASLLAEGIDYSNFKDAVKERQGKYRATVYMDIWSALMRLKRRDLFMEKLREPNSPPGQGDIEIMPIGKGGLEGMPPIRIKRSPEKTEE